jgi:hypothetical protein
MSGKTYMTPSDMATFKSMKEAGRISFFRIGKCKCGKAIPKSKQYCSKKCYEEDQ